MVAVCYARNTSTPVVGARIRGRLARKASGRGSRSPEAERRRRTGRRRRCVSGPRGGLHVHVAAGGVGIGADGVGDVDELLRLVLRQAGQIDVEIGLR